MQNFLTSLVRLRLFYNRNDHFLSTTQFCGGVWGMDTLSREATVKIVFPPFWKRIYSKRKEFAPKLVYPKEKHFLPTPERGSTLKGKNLLPFKKGVCYELPLLPSIICLGRLRIARRYEYIQSLPNASRSRLFGSVVTALDFIQADRVRIPR